MTAVQADPDASGTGEAPAGLRVPGPPRRWMRDLLFGARLAVTGGPEGWTRTALTALGVGLGVAVLLVAVSVPAMLSTRDARSADRTGNVAALAGGPPALRVRNVDTRFRDQLVFGRIVYPEGRGAPVPPGLARVPGAGDMVVSPALRRLLASPRGALLRPRIPYRDVGTIGGSGLLGPDELAYYAGSDRTSAGTDRDFQRIDGFGGGYVRPDLDPVLILLVCVVVVVLLAPVAVFVATAVRFGGERRDRRLAALRLFGIDSHMARRMAAGEALLGAMFGIVVGAVLFVVGRRLTSVITLDNVALFPGDVQPDPWLAAGVVLAVPTLAVAVTVLSMRRVVVDPLGGVRRPADLPRRLWWRLLPSVAGVALFLPLFGQVSHSGRDVDTFQVAAGAVLLLGGIATLLPWVVDVVVGRLRGGSVSWQFATRRLQLDGGAPARAMTGIAVAAAGAIALQMLFAGIAADYDDPSPARAGDLHTDLLFAHAGDGAMTDVVARFRHTRGVGSAFGIVSGELVPGDGGGRVGPPARPAAARHPLKVADCPTILRLAWAPRCADGDVFLVRDSAASAGPSLRPGASVVVGASTDGAGADLPTRWTVPAGASEVAPDRFGRLPAGGVLATPAAMPVGALRDADVDVVYTMSRSVPDAIDHVRNTVASVDPGIYVWDARDRPATRDYANIRRALFAGAVVTLLMIGLGLLVGTLEQLRERRRVLAVLRAFGTGRVTLCRSVLWQTAIPVVLGTGVAVVGGIGFGAVLLRVVDRPVRVDRSSVATMAGVAGGVVIAVTLLAMPVLWRWMRPDGLRTE